MNEWMDGWMDEWMNENWKCFNTNKPLDLGTSSPQFITFTSAYGLLLGSVFWLSIVWTTSWPEITWPKTTWTLRKQRRDELYIHVDSRRISDAINQHLPIQMGRGLCCSEVSQQKKKKYIYICTVTELSNGMVSIMVSNQYYTEINTVLTWKTVIHLYLCPDWP